jgi:hypothetical protein
VYNNHFFHQQNNAKKKLENLSDERVVLQFKRNPYYQYFCGYSNYMPCNATELVHFRKRIGVKGFVGNGSKAC